MNFFPRVTFGSQVEALKAPAELDFELLSTDSVSSGDLPRLCLVEAFPTLDTLYLQA